MLRSVYLGPKEKVRHNYLVKASRNDPCPCGSGKKFKKCHEGPAVANRIQKIKRSREDSLEIQRLKQQGHGRPVVFSISGNQKIVTVGQKTHASEHWKTFHDFLKYYLHTIFTPKWREQIDSHPLLEISSFASCKDSIKTVGDSIKTAPMNASLEAVMELSYSLYLVEHNCGALDSLIKARLLHPDQFFGASYELWIAGWMILAGFKISFEDESDDTRSHCEFTATYPKTGRSFSVEAKRGDPVTKKVLIHKNLNKALKKQADYPRIIFIEANLRKPTSEIEQGDMMKRAIDAVRKGEVSPPFKDRETDPAYVFVTNSPFQHDPKGAMERWAIAEGYKIPNLKLGKEYARLQDLIKARDEHLEVFDLMEALHRHQQIPVTFDGQIPELAFGNSESRLLIGERYLVPDGTSKEVEAELESATVIEQSQTATGVFRAIDGQRLIISCPLSDAELAAYKSHPETFLGSVDPPPTQVRDPLDFFDSMLSTYSKSSKDRLLEFMKEMPDFNRLQSLSQKKLARVYVERLTEAMIGQGAFHQFGPNPNSI